jgi:hypothetical protein
MKLADIPVLPGYISVARAAKILRMNKVSVYYKIYEQDAFRTVFKVPGAEEGSRPVILLLEAEVTAVANNLAAVASVVGEVPLRDRLSGWNKRVKAWGSETGWGDKKIYEAGQPSRPLQNAYLAAHPEDARPE